MSFMYRLIASLIIIVYLFHSCNTSAISKNYPQIITKTMNITALEGHTVTLPCLVKSLQSEHFVIWQHGMRGFQNQTLLTVGNLQIEKNYRIRILTNNENKENEKDVSNNVNAVDLANSSDDSQNSGEDVQQYNLELRKLQLNDSGWYECQLNTKPTIKNYIYLKVLSEPKLYHVPSVLHKGETIELVCEINYNGDNLKLSWLKDNQPIVVEKNTNNEITDDKSVNVIHSHNYRIYESESDNKIISKLVIRRAHHEHQGIYKCLCNDGSEKIFHLNLQSRGGRMHISNAFSASVTVINSKNNLLALFSLTIITVFYSPYSSYLMSYYY